MDTLSFQAADGLDIIYRRLLPADRPVRGAVQIAHGMAEHSGRYAWFAENLTAHGFAVYANDHRGHGLTAGEDEKRLGFFSESDGWNRVVDDMKTLSDIILNEHPGRPLFLFGHSMGSFLSRDFIARFGDILSGAILSGTAGHPGIMGHAGLLLARLQVLLKGATSPSPLMDTLSFGSYAKAFRPERTPFDWLSRDSDQVDAYIRDPLCGFIAKAGFYADLIAGLLSVNRTALIERTPKDLPIYLFSGALDPVGGNTRGVRKVHDAYQRAGVTDLTLRFYEEGRHEMLNEINRDQVADDVIRWIIKHLDKTPAFHNP
ncbi:alpha/beta hydrolase [Desulfatiferula olefinivorans]